jgi:hypothetical protein
MNASISDRAGSLASSLLKGAYYTYVGAAMSCLSRYPVGTNVYEREWDALLILDTCRVDALRAVASEYDFLPADAEIGSIRSVGTKSAEWIAQTFSEPYLEDVGRTALVTANAYTQRVIEERQFPDDGRGFSAPAWRTVRAADFLYLDQPWRYAPDSGLSHIPLPRPVTERAIAVGREIDPGRLVVHYNQPHYPFTARARAEGREYLHDHERDPFTYLREGGAFDLVWATYLDELRWVLDEVEILLSNLDAERVAISADHGEAFGEWGIYRHVYGLPHPKMARVPWAVTSAADEGTFEPTLSPPAAGTRESTPGDAAEQLRHLGYVE